MINRKNVEGSGHDLIRYHPSICLEEARKAKKYSVRIAGVRAEI
jgi:hypothetical protein